MSAASKPSRGEPPQILKARLSLGLGAVCVLAFILTSLLGAAAAGRRDAAMERAALHHREHPYLDAPLAVLLEAEADDAPAFAADGIDAVRRQREQAELDAIVAEAEAAERATPAFRFGVSASARGAARVLQLALHAFVHAGSLHLLWNLGLLAAAGARLELALGRGRYAGLLFGSAAAGATLHLFAVGPESAPLLGLSAASAGLVGAFAVRPGDVASDPLRLSGAKALRSPIRVAAILAVSAAALCAVAGVSTPSFEPRGLLGGFAFGALAMFGLARAGLIKTLADERLAPEVAKAVALLKAGDAPGAIELLRARLSGATPDALAARAFGLALRGRGDAREQLERALFGAIDAKQREVAPVLWRELAALGFAPRGHTAQLQSLAKWLRASAASGEARAVLIAALADADAATAATIAREARRADPVLALRAAERALSLPTLPERDRKPLAELLEQMRKDATNAGVVLLDAAREAQASAARPSAAPPISHEAPATTRGADPALIAGDDQALDLDALAARSPTEPELTAPEIGVLDAEAAHVGGADAGAELFFERGAIDLTAEESAPDLPDPEIAGETALLDAMHEALVGDDSGTAEDLARAETPELVAPEPGLSDLTQSFELPVPDSARLERTQVRFVEPPAPVATPPAAAHEFAFGTSETVDALFETEKPEPATSRLRPLHVSTAVPLQLDDAAIVLEIEGRGRAKLAYHKIDAVSAAGVRGISQSGKAVLLIDLAIGFAAGEGELRVVRLRADGFDPRTLTVGQGSPLAALRVLVSELRTRTRGIPLPPESEAKAPFRIYADLASYEREALGAESTPNQVP